MSNQSYAQNGEGKTGKPNVFRKPSKYKVHLCGFKDGSLLELELEIIGALRSSSLYSDKDVQKMVPVEYLGAHAAEAGDEVGRGARGQGTGSAAYLDAALTDNILRTFERMSQHHLIGSNRLIEHLYNMNRDNMETVKTVSAYGHQSVKAVSSDYSKSLKAALKILEEALKPKQEESPKINRDPDHIYF